MGGPRAEPGFVEFAVVDHHDGIDEIPVGSAGVYSQSTIRMRGGDVAVDDAKTVGRAEWFPLKVGRRGRNGHRWDAGQKIGVPDRERVTSERWRRRCRHATERSQFTSEKNINDGLGTRYEDQNVLLALSTSAGRAQTGFLERIEELNVLTFGPARLLASSWFRKA